MEKNKYESQNKWAEKNNVVCKSYKLNKKLIEEFKETCELNGISQASKLTELMRNFINESKEN